MDNVEISEKDLKRIRGLIDFDLIMFLSEINEHGIDCGIKLLDIIDEATAIHGDKR